MLLKLFAVCLIVYVCMCRKHDQTMFLAGPLKDQRVKGLKGEKLDTIDCSYPVPLDSRHYFEHLQSRGVTHFKVPLSWAQILPTGLPREPQQSVVTCYQNLLKELLDAGLQPLVILHGSSVPDSLRSRYGGWESRELVNKFQQYAEFVFGEFGQLVHYWVTLAELDEFGDAELQNVLDAHTSVYRQYHQQFPRRGTF
ncbi:lactase/phlorizin hydrolase-like [Takifugu flavidus]|uniref:lactase/phlorizin hydrolase-like n=1 Tax=Takifugu flavidus TaxID=433684 RepID=UPI002544A114|nr:lactase/phlorizin hydrolase-like [Takifugu flavidus]